MNTAAVERPTWRSVGVPSEHGGWGLTIEPVLLGLLVAPSFAGALIGLATVLAFLVRTPLKLALVDRYRGRWLDRSDVALRIALFEISAILALVAGASSLAGWRWSTPVAVAAPLVAVELWFDARSRSRRMLPELCGAVGIAAASAAIIVAAGRSYRLAAAMWLLLAARSLAAIPFVRTQIFRLRRGLLDTAVSDRAQLAAVLTAVAAIVTDRRTVAGAVAVAAIAALHTVWVRRDSPAAKVIGLRQMALGVALVFAAAAGVRLGLL